MKFDLDHIDTKSLSDIGVDMPVKRLNSTETLIARNGQPVTIRLRGPDSEVYRDHTRRQVQKRLARSSDAKKLGDIDFDEVESDSLDLLAAMTVGWANVLDPDGAPVPFSHEAARALYANYPIVREQVDAFVANRAHFLKASLES